MDYLPVQADNPWYNYYLTEVTEKNPCVSATKGGCKQLCVYHGGTSYSCLCKKGYAQTDNYFDCDGKSYVVELSGSVGRA